MNAGNVDTGMQVERSCFGQDIHEVTLILTLINTKIFVLFSFVLVSFSVCLVRDEAVANGLVTRGYIPQSGAQLVERRGNSP